MKQKKRGRPKKVVRLATTEESLANIEKRLAAMENDLTLVLARLAPSSASVPVAAPSTNEAAPKLPGY